ncbi:6-phosphogluconate dehydrogenase C-terminal domain-like protein [Tilletiaria anomala UBC 951]|uniref:6-phosphogluconate dehydrogenase C-terminal domain-like protein n=1 Tax=Tilletiaria anomala (strain ATCC 24038 / CBS 436.72 / UBC 951) TaxID=1037660 RepID=A0A066VDW8_TILAU|nr:6-phosphogluconate dehydrogenase C-terminal domain-like protein [Tilletiaria anomala UBC 951]KDN39917.1 6-phosphogluconate dehydrogenase C-terminal domain-like protein [Tilletiaria anomala UBC 951]
MLSSVPSTKPAPQVLTIGFGALGCLYSLLLERGGAQVTAVARSNYDAVQQHGVDIRSVKYGDQDGWKPHRVIRTPAEALDRVYDYILCTSKCTPDFAPLSQAIRPFLQAPHSGSAGPLLILIQNGIGIEDEVYETLVLREKLACGVVSCCAWVGCNLVDGGRRIEHGLLEKLEMGLFPTPPSGNSHATPTVHSTALHTVTEIQHAQAALESFVRIYSAGGGGASPVSDIQPARWRKLLWNTGWGGLAVLARQPLAKLIDEASLPFSIDVVRRTMFEVLYVARACRYGEDVLPASSVDNAINITLNMAPQMQHRAGDKKAAQGQNGDPRSAQHAAEQKKEIPSSPTTTAVVQRECTDDSGSLSGTALAAESAEVKRGRQELQPNFKPSILLDLEAGRPMELVPIFEAVRERARLHSVQTPHLDIIVAALRPAQMAAIEAARSKQVVLSAAAVAATTDAASPADSDAASTRRRPQVP